ncbi:MAG: N(4)-(beta-N-acetylglucosaminyl)-L-asparaginase [Saprospiraceae bacterium]|nr:N(4)-(beta-N-acetylglucosaminyl)-L-asparaginase [Saprospiraceae bacterium]
MSSNRRSFLKIGSMLVPSSFIPHKHLRPAKKPVVISTWDSGVTANRGAWSILSSNGNALDAVEQAGIDIENEVSCCVGLSGYPDRDGYVTLDACIMDHEANCGSVAFLERIKHPISVARKVMEETPHIMLVGAGAQQFALEQGFPLESPDLSPEAQKAYERWLEQSDYKPVINVERQDPMPAKGQVPKRLEDGSFNHDTMGTIAIDMVGNLSGMCTTSGLAFKVHGRVGDSPIIGAALFVDNEVGTAVCTGKGEEVIRTAGAHLVVEYMRDGLAPEMACRKCIERIVGRDKQMAKDFQVGIIALNKQGEVGAFAVQKGFNYVVTNDHQVDEIINARSYFG